MHTAAHAAIHLLTNAIHFSICNMRFGRVLRYAAAACEVWIRLKNYCVWDGVRGVAPWSLKIYNNFTQFFKSLSEYFCAKWSKNTKIIKTSIGLRCSGTVSLRHSEFLQSSHKFSPFHLNFSSNVGICPSPVLVPSENFMLVAIRGVRWRQTPVARTNTGEFLYF